MQQPAPPRGSVFDIGGGNTEWRTCLWGPACAPGPNPAIGDLLQAPLRLNTPLLNKPATRKSYRGRYYSRVKRAEAIHELGVVGDPFVSGLSLWGGMGCLLQVFCARPVSIMRILVTAEGVEL